MTKEAIKNMEIELLIKTNWSVNAKNIRTTVWATKKVTATGTGIYNYHNWKTQYFGLIIQSFYFWMFLIHKDILQAFWTAATEMKTIFCFKDANSFVYNHSTD